MCEKKTCQSAGSKLDDRSSTQLGTSGRGVIRLEVGP